MKKVMIYGMMSLYLFCFIACDSKDKPAANLEDLKEKYSGKEFENCEEYFTAIEEMMSVYIDAVENAEVDDEASKMKIDDISSFISSFDNQSEEFKKECPIEYEIIVDKYSKKIKKNYDKINAIYGLDEIEDEFEMIDEELQEALMEINEDEESDKRMQSGTE